MSKRKKYNKLPKELIELAQDLQKDDYLMLKEWEALADVLFMLLVNKELEFLNKKADNIRDDIVRILATMLNYLQEKCKALDIMTIRQEFSINKLTKN